MGVTRTEERLDALYAIGGGPGANRVEGSEGEQRAHDLAAAWMEEAGLSVDVDEAGNLFGRTSDQAVLVGSHLDSVPQGGRFDGALGVVAGIEALERVGRGAVVAFRGEESGCVGSTAFAASGPLPSFFLEVHVEQGPVLERLGAPLGLVTGVVGIVRGERVFEGPGGHAGTVPMVDRRDALVAAAEYVLHARATASAIEGAVATVGRVEVEPDFGNVIPSRVRLSVDARAPDAERLDRRRRARLRRRPRRRRPRRGRRPDGDALRPLAERRREPYARGGVESGGRRARRARALRCA
jgi:acetylornithine deacetylase/succinyl-diaminopimelate desuccinylase-like protein